MPKKIREITFDDNYFVENGYFIKKTETSYHGAYKYTYMLSTDKWNHLFAECIKVSGIYNVITPEIIADVIAKGFSMKREYPSHYKKLSPEEKLRRKEIRQSKKLDIEIEKRKNDNRRTK